MRGALIGLALLALAGCASPSLIPASLTLPVAQADTSLDAIYNVTATAYLQSTNTSAKAIAKPYLVKAYPFVVAADKAEALGDATTVAAQAADAMALIVEAKTALGVK